MTNQEKKRQIIENFDPNNPGVEGHIYGLPFDQDTADVIIIPVPWDVTVSYHDGTHQGPQAILEASSQIDYYLPDHPDVWQKGIYMLPSDQNWQNINTQMRPVAKKYIKALESGEGLKPYQQDLQQINKACEQLHQQVKAKAIQLLKAGKKVGLIGGEHSTPLGLMQALGEQTDFGILQIDAHADLRVAYEGFTYSHASIMYNALKIPAVKKLVQVGIRDLCEAEVNFARSDERVAMFFDQQIKQQLFQGKPWVEICEEIVADLPQQVYISFDIDGLQPWLCPHTGTPVPGGLNFEEAVFLISTIRRSGRHIIGFDVCEVAPGSDDWDANVGARLLYQLFANVGH